MNSSLNLVCIFPSSTNSTPLCMFRLSFLFYELLMSFLLFYGWFLLFWLAVSGQNGKVHFYLWLILLCLVLFWKWMGLQGCHLHLFSANCISIVLLHGRWFFICGGSFFVQQSSGSGWWLEGCHVHLFSVSCISLAWIPCRFIIFTLFLNVFVNHFSLLTARWFSDLLLLSFHLFYVAL